MNGKKTEGLSLKDRKLIVTGASSGIGQAIAIRASREGASVIALGRNTEKLAETLSLLEGTGHSSLKLELAESASVQDEIVKLLEAAGPVHGMVYCAGVSKVTPLRDIHVEEAERTTAVNWLSFLLISKALCRRGRYAPGMSVVAIASVSALVGQIGLSLYAGTKAALIASCRSLAAEYAPRGIRFNCVSPAPVDTPMQRETRERLGEDWYQKEVLNRAKLKTLTAEDIADPVLFLLSDASRGITGTNLLIDGGWALA